MLEPPKNIESGLSFARGIHSKIREILLYLERSRLIPGSGIRLTETPCGIAVSAEGRKTSGFSARKNEAVLEYSGPWGLYLEGRSIKVKPGLVWTPVGTSYSAPDSCRKPDEPSMIVLTVEIASSARPDVRMSTVAGDIDQYYALTDYWNSHALLGRYDPETDTVTQYHFSPIVFLLETEDFIILP